MCPADLGFLHRPWGPTAAFASGTDLWVLTEAGLLFQIDGGGKQFRVAPFRALAAARIGGRMRAAVRLTLGELEVYTLEGGH